MGLLEAVDYDRFYIATLSRLHGARLASLLSSCVNLPPIDERGSCFEGARSCRSRDTKSTYMDKPTRVQKGGRHRHRQPHSRVQKGQKGWGVK